MLCSLHIPLFLRYLVALSLFGHAVIAAPQPVKASEKISVVALVNGEPITSIDVKNRINFIGSVTGLEVNDRTIDDVRRDALQNLVDEKIKIQQARRDIPAILSAARGKARELVDINFANDGVSGKQVLSARGVNSKTIQEKFYADLLWSNVLSSRFARQFSTLDQTAEQEQNRIKNSMSEPQVKLSEIILLPTPKRSFEQTLGLANKIVDALRKGADFSAIAQQYSSAGTAAKGGTIGWIFTAQLPTELQDALSTAETGMVLLPIIDNNQIIIVRKEGSRANGMLDPKTTMISLSRAILPLTMEVSSGDQKIAAERLILQTKTLRNCADMEALNDDLGSNLPSSLGQLQLGSLSPQLQQEIQGLDVGDMSRALPFTEGMVVFMVCERINPDAAIPDIEQLKAKQADKLLSTLGRQYLLRLQRNAIIEYRD
ncbi:peptidylprolyl isomerase [Alphaproteobacteria bacterium]|nr:peptidylprolyl isomerase [Alphaproteobacteria bacterium]